MKRITVVGNSQVFEFDAESFFVRMGEYNAIEEISIKNAFVEGKSRWVYLNPDNILSLVVEDVE